MHPIFCSTDGCYNLGVYVLRASTPNGTPASFCCMEELTSYRAAHTPRQDGQCSKCCGKDIEATPGVDCCVKVCGPFLDPDPEPGPIRYAGMGLNAFRDCWIKRNWGRDANVANVFGDGSSTLPGIGLQIDRKLTLAHFQGDQYLAMKVSRAAQILSGTMVQIIQKCIDLNFVQGPGKKEMQRMAYLTNRLIDAQNSKKPAPGAVRSSSDTQLKWMLEFLAFYSTWRRTLQEDTTLSTQEKAKMFIPDTLWQDAQTMILGFISMCCYYLSDGPKSAVTAYDSEFRGTLKQVESRRVSSDACEHLFGDIRQRGNGGGVNAKEAFMRAGSIGTSSLHAGPKKGNSSGAPDHGGAAANAGLARPASAMTHKA